MPLTKATPNVLSPISTTNTANSIVLRDADGNINAATGGGTDSIFFLNGQTVNTSYTIPTSRNAGTFGPVTVAPGVTVTVPPGGVWTVV